MSSTRPDIESSATVSAVSSVSRDAVLTDIRDSGASSSD